MIEVDGPLTVALDPVLDEALVREGLARELTSRIQRLRKESGLAVTDRIRIQVQTESEEMRRTIEGFSDHISEEVLATELRLEAAHGGVIMDVDGHQLCVKLHT